MESNTTPKLSTQQQAILDWALNGAGSANVVARAGAGKTSTLIEVARQLTAARKGSVYLGAFNSKIAGELSAKLSAKQIPADASTLHSAGLRAWSMMKNAKPKVNQYKSHDLMDWMLEQKQITALEHELLKLPAVKAASYAKQSAVEILWSPADMDKWRALFDHFGLLDSVDFSALEEVSDVDPVANFVGIVCQLLQHSKQAAKKVIDFDDMLWMPVLADAKFQQYDFVCIDEAQDTNEIRRELALRMLKPGGRFIAVGDDKQAIYGFTGANSNSLQLIQERLGSVELPLTVSFRCGKAIIREAQRYVPDIEAWGGSPTGEVETVSEDEWDVYNLTDRDVVLCRVNAPLVKLAYSCIRNGIPARIEGRDIAAGLLAVTKRWKTVRLAAFEDQLRGWFQREIKQFTDDDGKPKKGCDAKAEALTDKYETLQALADATRTQYGAGASVEQMRKLIGDMFGDSDARDAKRMLTFCSVHKSKGMEWAHVCIYGADKFMPHPMATTDWAKEQEINLIYVAITRAQQRLTWVNVGGKPAERRER